MTDDRPWLERVRSVSTEPGVYLMRDREGEVIYVGKAANLRARLRSYFSASGDERAFVARLDAVLGDIETLVTANEKEALILENTLIKRYRPRFNVRLKDDKAFLLVRIGTEHPFPRLELVRRTDDDGAAYFGPYPSAYPARQLVRLVNRHFRLRACSDHVFAHRKRPCLRYAMGHCSAPCTGEVGEEDYARELEGARMLLDGRREELLETLRERMNAAAQALAFEDAARLRDQIRYVQQTTEKQRMVLDGAPDQDVHAMVRTGSVVALVTILVRQGRVWGQHSSVLKDMELPDEEVLSQYVGLFYDSRIEIPPLVVLPRALDDVEAKAQWLSDKRGGPVRIIDAPRSDQRHLQDLAARNAALTLSPSVTHEDQVPEALRRLAEHIGLAEPPARVECVDISAFHGKEAVGSLVALKDGRPDKRHYRRYRIRTVEGSDDFGMMRELLRRRFKRGVREQDLPNLLVVDGGKGQLGVAMEVVRELGLQSTVALAGLAKARSKGATPDGRSVEHSEERIFLPGRSTPIELARHSPERYLLERLRDEAHRFAITYHRKQRAKATVKSSLDDIEGVGPARRKQLLRRFGSVQAVRAASPEELARLPGIGKALAERILRALGRAV